MKVWTILSVKGREYCGLTDKHPYELFLQLEDIEHRTTKAGKPRSNCFIKQLLPDAARRAPPDQEPHDLIRDGCGGVEGTGVAYLETYDRPRPRDGGQDAQRGLRAGVPAKPPARKCKKPARKEVKPAT